MNQEDDLSNDAVSTGESRIDTVEAIRSRLVDTVLVTFAISAFPSLVTSLYRSLDLGWHSVMSVHIGAYTLILATAVLRRHLTFRLRASILFAVLFIVGIVGVLTWGLIGMGIFFLIIASIVATILFGTRAGVAAIAATDGLLAFITVAVQTDIITFQFDHNVYAVSLGSWLTATFSFTVFTGIIVATLGRLHGSLIGSVNDLNQHASELMKANTELGREISDRERAENALRESEAKFRTLVETTNVATFIHCGAHFRYVNPAMETISGFGKDELLRMDFWVLIHPDFRDDVRERGQARQRGESVPPRYETAVLTKSGERRWIDLAACATEFEGQPAVMGTFFDITERRRAENALSESERLYRRAIEVADAAAYYLNYATNTYEFMGDNISALTGYTKTELTPERMLEITEEDLIFGDLAGLSMEEAVERARKQGAPTWRSDYRIRTRSGKTKWLNDAAIQVTDESGEVIGALGILQDITERKEAEEERSRLEGQLRQAQKMEAVGQLAGGVAHDFNNLLQAILGYTEMGMSGLSPADRRHKDLQQVTRAAQRASTLTRQLLAFSRRQVLQPENLDMNHLIADLMKMLRRIIGEHIELDIIPGAGIGSVRADPGMLEQVLVNLCVNARDAMPDGGRLTIETDNAVFDDTYCQQYPWATPGRYVQLSVNDTGAGMPKDVVEHIFEPFYTTKKQGEGTGLGLSIVYGIVRQHKGLVHVYSEPGQGTVFKVCLPVTDSAVALSEEETAEPPPGGTETILLAEDDDTVRNLAARMLEGSGYAVIAARDGEEAVHVFRENSDSIDLALLDVVMPRLGGQATYDQIKAIKPGARVLFCSGYNPSTAQAGYALEEGMQLIQKPYTPDTLLRRVRDVLDGA